VAERKDVDLAYSMAFSRELFMRKETYACPKSGIVHAANSYAYVLCFRLDGDWRVKKFRYKKTRFEFYHPERKVTEGAFFDFDVTMGDGTRRLIYVTPVLFVHTPVEEAMIEGAESAASSARAKFELLTEADIFGPSPAYMKAVILYLMDKRYLEHEPAATRAGDDGDGEKERLPPE
jgi:hypothetical protein